MSDTSHPDFEGARAYARRRLKNGLNKELAYHSYEHTAEDIVPAVKRLAQMEQVSESDYLLLLTAAWFHDLGFTINRENHEENGVRIAQQVLPGYAYSDEQIDIIGGIILATRLPQTPHNLLEEIMADADLDSLGREDFFAISEYLRDEMALFGETFTDVEWYRFELNFMRSHTYFTKAARKLRNPGKQRNIAILEKRLQEIKTQED